MSDWAVSGMDRKLKGKAYQVCENFVANDFDHLK